MDFLLILVVVINIFLVAVYIKQKRLNRLLLHIFYDYQNKNYILDHMYFKDALNLKKDMNKMINVDIDISELEKHLKDKK